MVRWINILNYELQVYELLLASNAAFRTLSAVNTELHWIGIENRRCQRKQTKTHLVDTGSAIAGTQTTRVPVYLRALTVGIPAPFSESEQLAHLSNKSRLFRLPNDSFTVFLIPAEVRGIVVCNCSFLSVFY